MTPPPITHMRGRQASLFRTMLLATLPEEAWAQAQPTLSPAAQAILQHAPEPHDWVSLAALAELAKVHAELGGPDTSRVRGSVMAGILHGELPPEMTPVGFLQAMPVIFQESFQGGRLEVSLGSEGTAEIVLQGFFPMEGLAEKAIPTCLFSSLKQAGATSVIVDHLPPDPSGGPTRYRVRWF